MSDADQPSRPAKVRAAAVWAVGLIYTIAWFCPVIKGCKTLADGILPGWGALMVALSPLWDETNMNPVEATLSVCSGLTNIAFVLCFVLLLRRSMAFTKPLAWLLLGSTAVDTFWIYVGAKDLRAGYWLWFGSFALLWWVARSRRAIAPNAT